MAKRKEIDIHFDYSKVKGSTELHNDFKRKFMVVCSRSFPDISIIPYDVGFFRAYSQPDIVVRCGQEGVPDTIVFGDGFYLLFDMKTGKNKLQENQVNYKNRIAEINKGKDKVFKVNTIFQGVELIKREYEKAR